MSIRNPKHVAIIGGCGHVGLPLGVKFALSGLSTTLVDVNEKAVERVNSGHFPFVEHGGDEQLQEALSVGLKAVSTPAVVSNCDAVVFVIGTPVDEHLNPKLSDVVSIFAAYESLFKPGALVVMRSTLFPGTMEYLHRRILDLGLDIKLAFCPERVSQGYALDEIDSLPQIVSAFDDASFDQAYKLFSQLAPSVIKLTPLEAEMTKLMANSWRYLEFAIANQFYMIAEQSGVDFYRVYEAIRYDYPRASGYKSPGFAAGPCLFKDTMQLASYFNHQFYLGHSAMLVNEGLAEFVVDRLKAKLGDLWKRKVGLLGMGFKANNDDVRESLSYRVKKALEFAGAEVSFNDPYVEGSSPLQELLEQAEGLILCTPHKEYKGIDYKQPLVDVWAFTYSPQIEVFPGKQQVP